MRQRARTEPAVWMFAIAVTILGSCGRPKAEAEAPAATGQVELAIVVAGGANLERVSYEITGNDIAPIVGSVEVPAADASVSFQVGGIPAGAGYLLTLAAASGDGQVTCGARAHFDIVADQTASLAVVLQCSVAGTTGDLQVDGRFNSCPVVTSLSVAPLVSQVGGVIAVAASASDIDPGATVAYSWSIRNGEPAGYATVAEASAAATQVRCVVPGVVRVRLTVTDGACATVKEVSVTCLPLPVVCSPPVNGACASFCSRRGDLSPAKWPLFDALLACVRRTDCAATSNTVCLCGTAAPPVCVGVPGSANGPCFAEELAAGESTDLAVISARFTNPTYASGAVHEQLSCERETCSGSCW